MALQAMQIRGSERIPTIIADRSEGVIPVVRKKVVELDVRPILKAKEEPFQTIMETVDKLHPDEIFVLHATFHPVPLINVMKRKGFTSESVELAEEHWQVTFQRESI